MSSKKPTVLLGFEVGTGTAVEIPIGHMVVSGMTQAAGKTTTLEALVERSGLAAVTFITKRGEGSFTGGRRIPPFFREKADWVFVASLIDATLGEKNKLLRSWLMKVCRNTRTLAEVHRNVKDAQGKARGFAESIYTEIDGYLDLVVPQLRQLPPPAPITIHPGLNVVDLSPYSTELQALVIKSFLEHVYEHETDVITVIPEAWEFLPEGRGSPVKREAETLIRKGAALRNFVWLDSQDLAGVWKLAVRACPVYLIGVQREANEIKRTLENIPASVAKPSKADVATLGLGQFYACWGTHAVKTYVQPAWMAAAAAVNIAQGHADALDAWRTLAASTPAPATSKRIHFEKEPTVTEAETLRAENQELVRQNRHYAETISTLQVEMGKLRDQVRELASGVPTAAVTPPTPHPATTAAALQEEGVDRQRAAAQFPSGVLPADFDMEGLYLAIAGRLAADAPHLLKIAVTRPEMVVEVERKVVAVQGETMKGRVARLMAQGWFGIPRAVGAVRQELKRTGTDPGGGGALGIMLNNFVKDGFFVREGDGFLLAPGVTVSERELTVA